jgi:hypothetical protein
VDKAELMWLSCRHLFIYSPPSSRAEPSDSETADRPEIDGKRILPWLLTCTPSLDSEPSQLTYLAPREMDGYRNREGGRGGERDGGREEGRGEIEGD